MAREAEYTEQLSALIAKDPDLRIRTLAEKYRVSLSQVVRDVIDAGLPSAEAAYADRAATSETS